MVKTGAERQKALREKRKKDGYVSKVVWVMPEVWDDIQEYIEFKNASVLAAKKKKSKK